MELAVLLSSSGFESKWFVTSRFWLDGISDRKATSFDFKLRSELWEWVVIGKATRVLRDPSTTSSWRSPLPFSDAANGATEQQRWTPDDGSVAPSNKLQRCSRDRRLLSGRCWYNKLWLGSEEEVVVRGFTTGAPVVV